MSNAKIVKIVEDVSSLTVLEINELQELLMEKFGIDKSALVAAPVAAAQGNVAAAASDSVSIILKSGGQNKIAVIKEIKDILGLGLKEAKDFVDGAPKEIKSGIKAAEAEEIKNKLTAAGAEVELK